jgi:hypothetical protein
MGPVAGIEPAAVLLTETEKRRFCKFRMISILCYRPAFYALNNPESFVRGCIASFEERVKAAAKNERIECEEPKYSIFHG